VETTLTVLATVALPAIAAALASAHSPLRPTTLAAAWGWAALAAATWVAAWIAAVLTPAVRHGAADLLWYAVAVTALCPPLVVLGARRPGSRAWTWFVVLPLPLVLSLPAVTAWTLAAPPPGEAFPRFHLEAPWAIGFGLVLVMGFGNYVGTRWTLPALGSALAVLLLVLPLVEGLHRSVPSPAMARRLATLCLGLSALLALTIRRRGHRSSRNRDRPHGDPHRLPLDPLDILWRDFRDLYGLVWARRVMDRINESLAARRLAARLEWSGLVSTAVPAPSLSAARPAAAGQPPAAAARRQAEQTLRWLLKRFVSAEWIDQRLNRWSGELEE
jgi:hypothetical protein